MDYRHRITLMKQICTALAMVALVGAVASAQSLGDIAKKEEARRKAVSARSKGKVYTNDSVGGEAKPASTAGTNADGSAGQPAAEQPAAQPPASEQPAAAPVKDEAAWRKRAKDARDTIDRAKMFEEALQSRINALSADFVNRDDPAQRSVVGADRQKALAELDRVRKDIKTAEKALIDLEDEARKAGVPAGWLR